jgi:hypothetical protein
MANKVNSKYGVAVTPHDSTNFTDGVCIGIYVGGAGDAVLIQQGNAVTYTGLLAGSYYPFECTRINSTSTTATNIVALY